MCTNPSHQVGCKEPLSMRVNKNGCPGLHQPILCAATRLPSEWRPESDVGLPSALISARIGAIGAESFARTPNLPAVAPRAAVWGVGLAVAAGKAWQRASRVPHGVARHVRQAAHSGARPAQGMMEQAALGRRVQGSVGRTRVRSAKFAPNSVDIVSQLTNVGPDLIPRQPLRPAFD